MVEGGGDESGGLDLGDAVGAHPGEATFSSAHCRVSAMARWCSALRWLPTGRGASAHTVEMDFTGVKVGRSRRRRWWRRGCCGR